MSALLLLQGFVTRDRRKDSAREADQHLVELEQADADNLSENLGEDGAGPASEAGGFVLDDVFNDQSQFHAMLHTVRVLLGSGQPQEAQQLTDDMMRMFSKRGADRRVPITDRSYLHVLSIMRLLWVACCTAGR